MKNYFKLYEEFTQKTGMDLAKKLLLYTQASDVPTHVSEITTEADSATFTVDTNMPGDYSTGTKSFKVYIPLDTRTPYVETYEGGKRVAKDTIETTGGDNTVFTILMNYFEILQLFNDPSLDYLSQNYYKIHTVEDIKKLIKNYG